MNIFYLDREPKTCAEMHCDKHVVKIIIVNRTSFARRHSRCRKAIRSRFATCALAPYQSMEAPKRIHGQRLDAGFTYQSPIKHMGSRKQRKLSMAMPNVAMAYERVYTPLW